MHKTLNQLSDLKLLGMKQALEQQSESPKSFDLSFEERFSFIVQNEVTLKENNKIKRLTKNAKFMITISPDDLSYKNLDRSQISSILTLNWIGKGNLIISGPTGTGKTYLSSAIGTQACNNKMSVLYIKTSHLINEIKLSKLDGSYTKLFNKFIKPELLIIDDFGMQKLDTVDNEILDIFDQRYYSKSNIFIGQLPPSKWHDLFTNPTIADALLDRITSNAIKIILKGESLRKRVT